MNHTQKRVLSILAAAAMTCSALPQSAPLSLLQPVLTASAEDSVSEDLIYIGNDDHTGIIITGYNGTDTTLVIPDTLPDPETNEYLPVTAIKSWALSNKNTLASVILPDSITIIENNAFNGCTNLKEIDMPAALKIIDNSVFSGCSALEEINIPNGTTSIGNGAFSSCTALASVTIPETVTSIGEAAFRYTAWLTAKREENPLVIVNHILIDGATCSGDVVFPDDVTVTHINDQAFYHDRREVNGSWITGNTTMTSITIPDTVTSIGNQAFKECTALTSITIPDSVTEIGTYAFSECTALTEAVFPDTLPALSAGLFFSCSSLTSVKLPSGLIKIEANMFQNCSNLKEITIPETVEKIDSCAFLMCSNVESIVLPKTLTDIGMYAFRGCSALKSVVVLNPETHFHAAVPFVMCSDDLTFYGYTGSTAETYAQQNGYAFESLDVKFSDISLTLTDDLALNFFAANVDADDAENYKVIFSGKCEEKGKDIALTEKNGRYCATANVSADHMGEKITASLYKNVDGAWEKIDTCKYSVNQYLEKAAPEADWSEEKAEAFDKLVETVKLYGEVSYAYFKTPDDMPEVTDYYEEIRDDSTYNAYHKVDKETGALLNDTENTDKISLVLNSKLAMRWYLDGLTEGDTGKLDKRVGLVHHSGSTTITAKSSAYGAYFEITDISPLWLNLEREIGYNGYSYTLSPLTWAYRVMMDNIRDDRDVAMANMLYEYYINATAFNDAN